MYLDTSKQLKMKKRFLQAVEKENDYIFEAIRNFKKKYSIFEGCSIFNEAKDDFRKSFFKL